MAELVCGTGDRDAEVHVDWRMTQAEWNELRLVLILHRRASEYVTRLYEEGKLDG